MNAVAGKCCVVVFTILAVGCSGSQATPQPSASISGACANLGQFVTVGGTAGFDDLADPNFTTALLATGHVRLYEHANAIASAIASSPPSNPYAILDAIEKVFGRTGPGEAELGLAGSNYFTLPAARYPEYYRYQFVKSGLKPNAVNVNVPYRPASAIAFDKANVRAWKAWVRAGRSVGITSMAPIVAPNAAWKADSPLFPPTRRAYYDLNSAFYDLARFEASYGGGIAFDTPSKFFLAGGSGAGYREFIERSIRWGNARGLRTTVLVSPYDGRSTFAADTMKFVSVLLAHDAVPTEWSVDDYEDTNPNNAGAMGPDTLPNSTTGVGLWLATNAPVYAPIDANGRAAGGAICRR